MLAPAGVKQHRIARRRLDVRDADHLAGIERRDVHEPAAGDDLGHRLDAEPLDTRGVRELGDAPAVVAAIADLQVAEGVQVGAELLGAGDLLGDPVDPVRAEAAAVAVMGGGDQRLAEVALRKRGRVLVEYAPEVVEPP